MDLVLEVVPTLDPLHIRSIKLIINKSFIRPYLENLIADHFLRKLKMFSTEHV